jgi:hypothetical protein
MAPKFPDPATVLSVTIILTPLKEVVGVGRLATSGKPPPKNPGLYSAMFPVYPENKFPGVADWRFFNQIVALRAPVNFESDGPK